jgi:hypothetical protein
MGEIEESGFALIEEVADGVVAGAVVVDGEIADSEVDRAIGEDLLGIAIGRNDCAEGLVAVNEELEGCAESVELDGATEGEGDGLVVDAGGVFAGGEEGPEAALGGGEREGRDC